MMKIKIFTVGGTIDKVYFDAKSTYQVGDPRVTEILKSANITFEYECESLLYKDSLDMDDQDRQLIFDKLQADTHQYIVITHGTDTMVETARKLQAISDKVIVLTGAMEPARFISSDAVFNVGCAIGAVQCLPPGIYIAMNGRIFHADKVRKNVELNRFEET